MGRHDDDDDAGIVRDHDDDKGPSGYNFLEIIVIFILGRKR